LNPKSCIDSSEFSSRNEKELNFQENLVEKKQTETPCVIPKIGRRHKNKRENDDADTNFDDQSKKKSKKHGNNLGNILQHWIEQQGVRQIELDKRREEKEKKEQDQRLELLHMKQQSDMMLFGILNNLSNSLNSLHTKKNQVNQVNQGIVFSFRCDLISNLWCMHTCICMCARVHTHVHASINL
jgi:hypothetical protein